MTPAVRPVAEAVRACARAYPEIAINLIEIPASLLEAHSADLYIRLEEPNAIPAFIAPLAKEEVVVIVNSQNPIGELANSDLQAIYTGQMRAWPDLGVDAYDFPIQVWDYPPGDELAQLFHPVVIGLQAVPSTLVSLAPDPKAMLEAVTDDPGGIGYLPNAWLDNRVRPVTSQLSSDSPLQAPVLAYSEIEPDSPLREVVICLQSEEGQTTLGKLYPR